MKDKTTAIIFALFLGGIGGHKFYLRQTGMGLVYLLFCWTFIPALIAMVEIVMLLVMSKETFDARFNAGYLLRAAATPQNIVVNVANTAHAGGADTAGRLKSLHDLKVSGALTEEEYASEKKKLLAG